MERTDRPREGKGGALPEEQEEGLGFPHLLHSGRKCTDSPRQGTRSEVKLPVPAWIWVLHQCILEWLEVA